MAGADAKVCMSSFWGGDHVFNPKHACLGRFEHRNIRIKIFFLSFFFCPRWRFPPPLYPEIVQYYTMILHAYQDHCGITGFEAGPLPLKPGAELKYTLIC